MVAVVLLTTLLTPLAPRGAFQLKSPQDFGEAPLASRPAKVLVDPGHEMRSVV